MRFGITFFPTIGPEQAAAADWYDDAVNLAVLADELGYHHVKTVEHYFFAYGGYSPDPVPLLTAIARATRRIRVATGAVIPAFNHPVQLAARLAVLDNLSRGRLDVGFGRAFLPDEFAAFQVSLDESRARFEEGVRAVERLWSEQDVVWQGTFHQFGPVTLLPRPYQDPHPPIYVATATSPASAEAAGRAGRGLQGVPAISGRHGFQDILTAYRKAWADGGHEPGEERIQISFGLFLAEDGDEARALGRTDEELYSARIAEATSAWGRARSADYPGYERLEKAGKLLHFDERLKDNQVLAGNPAEVTRQIEQLAEWYGDDVVLSFTIHSGNLPAEVSARSLRLFTERVAPAFAR
ncbi:LLM class flavin-dependent oxidoreductase [Candidatus Protofrankia californiensis]|uniref:LLM class flavin-dependent oxidoreductase n=1 Tax=Candidatus Protofrankia californiensis TaxID=1839754 RepID=UPI00104198DE|nr:LLM class flavin-dependent oxidoreductase [Candidatus Protofrankia californiensis]